jgi:ABC-type branched-subunit amino acid transport system ATPase component
LNGINLHAKEGELVVLLGANGAGKSSIFLTASGLQRAATRGSIRFGQPELVGMKPSEIVERASCCALRAASCSRMSVLQEPDARRLCAPARQGRHPEDAAR